MQTILAPFRRALSQPSFVVVLVILLAAAAGLKGATDFMKLHFRKLPVPLARPLNDIPEQLGPWQQVSVDIPLQHDIQEALATDKYIFRDYVDTRQVDISQFKDKSSDERRRLLFALQMQKPSAVVNASVTYYTGLVDTVAHVPERCYVADGYEPSVTADLKWDTLAERPGTKLMRYITFEDTSASRLNFTRNVAYVFQCNGEYNSDSIAVRKRLADLRERYGYYMKVEVQTLNLSQSEASRVMNDFLSNLLPESEKCLADWNALKRQPAPENG